AESWRCSTPISPDWRSPTASMSSNRRTSSWPVSCSHRSCRRSPTWSPMPRCGYTARAVRTFHGSIAKSRALPERRSRRTRVVRWDCTLLQYIGELCRYLVNSPPHPKEQSHRLRLACGNGLRPDVWAPFKERFRIPQIIEFYGATEGNVTLFNFEGKEGAVGR